MSQQKEYPELYRTELQRVLESEALRHSDSMRRLLEYLGEKALEGSTELKEYTIGLEAFHKPKDYDPQLDATVRVLASKLRRKLDEFYAKEGAGSPVRFEIPRGHYELRFCPQTNEDPSSIQRKLQSLILGWQWIALALGVSALLLLLALFWRSGLAPANPSVAELEVKWPPELEKIWKPFLESSHNTLISLGTPLFIKLSDSLFRDPGINDWPAALESEQVQLLQKELKSDYAVPSYSYTGVGEATGAFLLSRLLGARTPDMHLMRSSALNWDDLRTNNVIFLGSPRKNPILNDIPAAEGFLLDQSVIRNLRPRPGEQDTYSGSWSDDHMQLLEDYALIYRLPGQYGHTEIMILGSASTEGTWAAAYYVTKPIYAKELIDKVGLISGALPPAYQIVLRVEFKQQVPWKISYVTHRVLEQPWKPGQPSPSGVQP
jgi:hypothetical protein